MSTISYSPKAQRRRERAALATKWANSACHQPDRLLWEAAMVAAAFVFLFVVTM